MKLAQILLTGSLLLVLAGCGNDSPVAEPPTTDPGNPPTNPGTPGGLPGFPGGGLPTTPDIPAGNGISGTVTAPAGGDVSNTIVGACPGNAATATCNDLETQTVIVEASGAYSFTDLSATEYIVIAIKDATGDGSFGSGDYGGVYTTDGTAVAAVTPPATDVNITMELVDDGSGSPTTPTDPSAGGSIAGTISPPGAVAGDSAVAALYLTDDQNNPFDYDLSGFAEIPAGSSFDYSVDSLTAGQYVVVGLSDVDGNGSFEDEGDYVGIYPSVDTLQTVSPPAADIDIPMTTNSELDALSVQSATRTAKALGAAKASLEDYQLKAQLERALKTLR